MITFLATLLLFVLLLSLGNIMFAFFLSPETRHGFRIIGGMLAWCLIGALIFVCWDAAQFMRQTFSGTIDTGNALLAIALFCFAGLFLSMVVSSSGDSKMGRLRSTFRMLMFFHDPSVKQVDIFENAKSLNDKKEGDDIYRLQ